jgi:hypothetical protein
MIKVLTLFVNEHQATIFIVMAGLPLMEVWGHLLLEFGL